MLLCIFKYQFLMHADAFAYVLWHFLIHHQATKERQPQQQRQRQQQRWTYMCERVTWWLDHLFIDHIDLYAIKIILCIQFQTHLEREAGKKITENAYER